MPQNGHGNISKNGKCRIRTSFFSNVLSRNPFYAFDPQKEVTIRMLVAIEIGDNNQLRVIHFYCKGHKYRVTNNQ
jgi:hypothetical protein